MTLDRAFSLAALAQRTDLEWTPFRPGVDRHTIYETPEGTAAVLLRYQPGTRGPLHEHTGHEHILVLEGVQSDERGDYPAGTMIINEPGSRHAVWSAPGCLVLVIWQKPVRFL